ncbi:hypothetical protein K435DRAFT_700336 [Dendrothele bispora CBS 962.96]|uniref:Uncharacterized protein n=1 Tax=Dendrothele bispora (strain CBS 962.96) TaxID=1314807 RepID=A0A4S8KSE6_DENBC|nr:hypothetical protein K435DRAFT_700336 [Dendrothele bispora CBS 962.96]
MHVFYNSSPQAYKTVAQYLKLRTPRSIRDRQSKDPRFPIGICEQTFQRAEKYLEDYGWPKSFPLALSVDDTKLFATLAPLRDNQENTWVLVGTVGDQTIKIPDIDSYREFIDNGKEYELSTKLRLWGLQIPLPGIPALPLAVLPISSSYKAPQLLVHQKSVFEGLISHGFTVLSNGSDGAAVERDVQRRLSSHSKTHEYQVRDCEGNETEIIVTYFSYEGNFWVNAQDSKHFSKTGRNNVYAGPRLLILGDFVLNYEMIYHLAHETNSPLYKRDVVRYDKQDDNAAARLYSTSMLEHTSRDPANNMGLIIYFFVFGEFVDAYQSHTMPHLDRVIIVFRTLLFLETWRKFLAKSGYSQHRYFISAAAYDICCIAGNALLALIIIHRNHFPTCPLAPFKHGTEFIEHIFAELRKAFPDFTMQQALLTVPRLVKLSRASYQSRHSGAMFSKPSYKDTAHGYQHTCLNDADASIKLDVLRQFPNDTEISGAYQTAAEENEVLWGLLGVPILDRLLDSDLPSVVPEEGDQDDDNEEDVDPEDEESDDCVRKQLEDVIQRIEETSNIRQAEEEQLTAYELASIAISLQELANIEQLPDGDEETAQIIRNKVADAISQHPRAVTLLLQNAASATLNSSAQPLQEICTHYVTDVTSADLSSLVSIRHKHQTVQAATGVRHLGKSADNDSALKPPSERQQLAREITSLLHRAESRGPSTGLNRKNRWVLGGKEEKVSTTSQLATTGIKTGNAANAEAAAKQ